MLSVWLRPQFEKKLVEVQDRRMSTCNRLDLQTPGSQPIMTKNLLDHWTELTKYSRILAMAHITPWQLPPPHPTLAKPKTVGS